MIGRDGIAAINSRLIQEFTLLEGEDVWHWGLRTTSGTTGHPIVGIVQRKYGEWFYRSERSIMCLGTMGIRLLTVKTVRRNSLGENKVLGLDVKDLEPGLTPIVKDFKPDRLIGFPSFILRLAEYIDEETAKGVIGLHIVGESITPELERTLLRRFPHAVIRSMYVAAEFGVISKPNCAYLPRNWYHPLSGISIEIFEPDEGGAGDILVSGKKNETIEVRQYRVGDVGRIKQGLCPCGEEISFEVLGRRGHDYIKLAGALLRQEEFDRVATALQAFDDYRAEVIGIFDNEKLKGKITLRIFKNAIAGTKDSAKEIGKRFSQELFITQTRTLADLVASGDFLPLEVIWVQKPFEHKHKNVKLIQTVL